MAAPQEPPTVSTYIPYVGHVIGFMRSKFEYLVQLKRDNPLPIFTLNMAGQKLYIITTPHLIQATQKQPKALAFPPIEAEFAAKLCGPSKEAEEIVNNNVNGEEGSTGLSMELHAAMRAALSPSAGFDEMNRRMVRNMSLAIDGLEEISRQHTTIGLSKWLRQSITVAATDAVYGTKNPFKDPEIVDAFWKFNSEITTLLVGILPNIIARKGIAARTKVAKAFEKYYTEGGLDNGSVLARNRYDVAVKNGVALEDIARFEVGGSVGILVNTTPAAFWTLFFVYSSPNLLEDIRKELDVILVAKDDGPEMVRSVDIKSLKQRCPLLISVFQETMRHIAVGLSVRKVMEDTILDGQWLLKKDGMVQMPSRIIHKDASIWGTSVEEYNPRRFMKDSTSQKQAGGPTKRPPAAAFRAFGGGTTLCPGRHFATNEVLATAALFALRYDMTPVKGEWTMPTTHNSSMAGFLMEPDSDVEVKISFRKGFETGRVACGLEESDEVLAFIAEDISA